MTKISPTCRSRDREAPVRLSRAAGSCPASGLRWRARETAAGAGRPSISLAVSPGSSSFHNRSKRACVVVFGSRGKLWRQVLRHMLCKRLDASPIALCVAQMPTLEIDPTDQNRQLGGEVSGLFIGHWSRKACSTARSAIGLVAIGKVMFLYKLLQPEICLLDRVIERCKLCIAHFNLRSLQVLHWQWLEYPTSIGQYCATCVRLRKSHGCDWLDRTVSRKIRPCRRQRRPPQRRALGSAAVRGQRWVQYFPLLGCHIRNADTRLEAAVYPSRKAGSLKRLQCSFI
jgi:hypothetical protein